MYFEDETHDKCNNFDINNLNTLNFNFVLNDRFIYVKDQENNYLKCQTPFLKVLKPIYTTLNKKKTIAKNYLILETNDELDFNNQIGEFMFVINKIHEISQEKIRENSLTWFNTEFDDIGLDIKVKRPIEHQKDNEFIRIAISKDKDLENQMKSLSKGEYVLCNIIFKGLKISNECITEEWELKNYITQEKYDEMQNGALICDNSSDLLDIDIPELVKHLTLESQMEEVQEMPVEEVQETQVEEVQETKVEEVQETKVEEVQETQVEEVQKIVGDLSHANFNSLREISGDLSYANFPESGGACDVGFHETKSYVAELDSERENVMQSEGILKSKKLNKIKKTNKILESKVKNNDVIKKFSKKLIFT